jgi:hypothetical protein
MMRHKAGRKQAVVGLVVLLLAVIGLTPGIGRPGSADAAIVHCRSVVKKIYRLNDGLPPFFKAKVLIVRGSVGCETARRIIWKGLVAGGYNGTINGWSCLPKGMYDPFAVKCSRRSPATGEREVIKSSRPRSCPICSANEN